MSNTQTSSAPGAGPASSGPPSPHALSGVTVRRLTVIAYLAMIIGFCFLFWGTLWPDADSKDDNYRSLYGLGAMVVATICAAYLAYKAPNDIPKLTRDTGAQVFGLLLTVVGFIVVPLVTNETPDIHPFSLGTAGLGLALSCSGFLASLKPPSAQLAAAHAAADTEKTRADNAEAHAADLKTKAERYMGHAENAMQRAESFLNGTSSETATDVQNAFGIVRTYKTNNWT